MPDKKAKITTTKTPSAVTPSAIKGLSAPVRVANIMPSNIGPARLAGNLAGVIPQNTRLPDSVLVTQGYHPGHTALDLAGPAGMNVYAPESMKIIQAGAGPWGLDVIGINPASGNRFTFGHFAGIAPGLQVGEVIPAGTLIGFEGSTFTAPGYSTGPHVHLQVNAPGGAAVMPSAADVLNTFTSGLINKISKTPGAAVGGSRGPIAPLNTTLLNGSDASRRSLAAGGQVSQAVNNAPVEKTSKAATSEPRPPTSAEVTTAPAPGRAGTTAPGNPTLKSFLSSHSPADYIIMAIGLAAFIFGVILLYGQIMQAGFNRDLGTIDRTTETVKKVTDSAGGVAGLFA